MDAPKNCQKFPGSYSDLDFLLICGASTWPQLEIGISKIATKKRTVACGPCRPTCCMCRGAGGGLDFPGTPSPVTKSMWYASTTVGVDLAVWDVFRVVLGAPIFVKPAALGKGEKRGDVDAQEQKKPGPSPKQAAAAAAACKMLVAI